MIGYLDKAMRQFILIMSKMNGYVKTFKVKEGVKDKNHKLMSFFIDDEKLLEKSKAIWTKIEDLKNIKLNALPAYDDRYIKTKIRTLNMPEDYIKCGFFGHFYWLFTCIWKQILPASILRQLCS